MMFHSHKTGTTYCYKECDNCNIVSEEDSNPSDDDANKQGINENRQKKEKQLMGGVILREHRNENRTKKCDEVRRRSVEINMDSSSSSCSVENLAKKRAKNADAARKYRQRKVMKMENLEKQVLELTNEKYQLKTRLSVLEVGRKILKEKELELNNRIEVLECQLTELHKKL